MLTVAREVNIMRKFQREGKTMGIIDKSKLRGKAGFSLLELMVVVAILGVLATVAVPRFNIFRARSRQGEAKVNLGVIFTLQETFKIEHEEFYDGDKARWGGDDMITGAGNSKGVGYISRTDNSGTCGKNKLGFRIANCSKARYAYLIAQAAESEFLAIAHGMSDKTEKRIFPGCEGAGDPKDADDKPTGAKIQCLRPGNDTRRTDGDAWCMDETRNLSNYRDIVEFCDG